MSEAPSYWSAQKAAREARRRQYRREAEESKHYGPCKGCGRWRRKSGPKEEDLCVTCLPRLKETLER